MIKLHGYDALSPLQRVIYLREMVHALCAAIDAGECEADGRSMLALAEIVRRDAGPLALELVCELARRTVDGREALKALTH